MSYYTSDINVDMQKIDPVMLVDEVSATVFYIGMSKNTSDIYAPHWRIKKIWKDGSVWHFGFPDGHQGFDFVWDDRTLYVYEM
jgi:hypothetical protein